jgi:Outer membrane protein beta-barrel domain
LDSQREILFQKAIAQRMADRFAALGLTGCSPFCRKRHCIHVIFSQRLRANRCASMVELDDRRRSWPSADRHGSGGVGSPCNGLSLVHSLPSHWHRSARRRSPPTWCHQSRCRAGAESIWAPAAASSSGSHRPLAKAGDNFNANGVTVGAGAEYKFTDNLSLRGEYRFTNLENSSGHRIFDFEDDDYFARSAADVNIQQVLFTLNWRFGGFGLPF